MFLIALALAATQAEPASPAEPVAEPMTIEIVRDAITDRMRATATLRANGERIEIRCHERDWGDVSVEYHSRHWIARGNALTGLRPITYRFDRHAPVRRFWRINDRTARFDGRNHVISFINNMMGARSLVLRSRDIENRSFDAVFPIGATEPAIVQLLHTCGSHRINPRIIGEQ